MGQNLLPERVVCVTEVVADDLGFTKILRLQVESLGTCFSDSYTQRHTHTHTHTHHCLQGTLLLLCPAFPSGFQTFVFLSPESVLFGGQPGSEGHSSETQKIKST